MKRLKDNLKDYEWGVLLFCWSLFGAIGAIYVWAYYAAMG